jgi:hypothetical protein
MNVTQRNRYYSAPPSQHNVANNYIWDDSAVITGASPPTTGAWRPLVQADFGAAGGSSSLANNPTGTFGLTTLILTSGQTQIPANSLSYAITVESGYAYFNGILINTSTSLNGGGYEFTRTNTAINVGCTGGRAIITYETPINNSYIAVELTQATGGYMPVFAVLTSGVNTIPVGAKTWSFSIESGSAIVNNIMLNAGFGANGGTYEGNKYLTGNINIGCTGGRVVLMWEY